MTTPKERTEIFISGFLDNLTKMYSVVLEHERMLFDVAKKRTYEENLNTLITSPIEPSKSLSPQEIEEKIREKAQKIVEKGIREPQKSRLMEVLVDHFCAQYAAHEKNRLNFREMFGKDDFKEGNCTAIPMHVLMEQPDNPLKGLSKDYIDPVNPTKMIEKIKQIKPDLVYETDDAHNFADLFAKHNIGVGALVIVATKKEIAEGQKIDYTAQGMTHSHLVVCTGFEKQADGTMEPLYISFDDERINHKLSPHRQCGYIIDLPKLIEEEYTMQQNQLLKERSVNTL